MTGLLYFYRRVVVWFKAAKRDFSTKSKKASNQEIRNKLTVICGCMCEERCSSYCEKFERSKLLCWKHTPIERILVYDGMSLEEMKAYNKANNIRGQHDVFGR